MPVPLPLSMLLLRYCSPLYSYSVFGGSNRYHGYLLRLEHRAFSESNQLRSAVPTSDEDLGSAVGGWEDRPLFVEDVIYYTLSRARPRQPLTNGLTRIPCVVGNTNCRCRPHTGTRGPKIFTCGRPGAIFRRRRTPNETRCYMPYGRRRKHVRVVCS